MPRWTTASATFQARLDVDDAGFEHRGAQWLEW
jgi:hypothetical protein